MSATLDEDRFVTAPTFDEHLARVVKNRELWQGVYERVRLAPEVVERAKGMGSGWRIVVLSEDWCGDAVNTVPVIASLTREAGWDLRILSRDRNPDLMDSHLTNGRSRSIPVVILYDRRGAEVGWWGPRPRELQAWVMSEGLSQPSPERYKEVRRWYAKDRGQSTLEEVLALFPDDR